ncbi:MAG: DUF4982 domain-containing protein [Bacteroidales bacterium]|nr:DUF4982 domain-containing protein [Bacteroidales bacterium]
MFKRVILLISAALAALLALKVAAQPTSRTSFNEGWTFTKDGKSRAVDLPHDWGVDGPFNIDYPGETGKLEWWGKAEYTKTLVVDQKSSASSRMTYFLDIDGAMSWAKVFCNGNLVTEWPYGYASFRADLTPYIKEGENKIKITLDNPEESSRWYPGGGIYRNVWLTVAPAVGVAHWGTYMTTKGEKATLAVSLRNSGPSTSSGAGIAGTVRTEIFEYDGNTVIASAETAVESITDSTVITQEFDLPGAARWSPDHPTLYKAITTVIPMEAGAAAGHRPYSAAAKRGWMRTSPDSRPADEATRSENGRGRARTAAPSPNAYITVFGLRDLEYREDGLYIDGVKTFLKGVCLHHDAGALGAVWNNTAWERRLKMLKEMGCNAIRTSHNPPAPELLDLCDRMGFVVMDELTDTWTVPKKRNGYALLFNDWAEKDLKAMIHRDRNHPSVILWSIGNETGEQGYPNLYHIPARLTEICHNEDPTRLTSFGSDNPWASEQEFRNTMDVYGFNYKPHLYSKFHEANPGKPYLGSETASTISTRGNYFFPIEEDPRGKEHSEMDFQVSSYDLHTVPWGQIPEQEWKLEDENPSCLGEFVWTGYDYLGEPTPYNRDLTILTNFHDPEAKAKAEKELAEKGSVKTPSRSSYFGIIDLAGFPKDRYWLYQARWSEKTVLHVLPHWNWPGREGEVTPVHVYTNCDKVELFVNGQSQGTLDRSDNQYRLRWDDVVYQPGKVEAIGWKDGKKVARETIKTSGPAAKIKACLEKGFGEGDLYYIDVKLTDKKGNFVPTACDELKFSVTGPGEILAVDAGDPTCLTPFHSDMIKAFNGLASVIIKVKPGAKGKIVVTATSDNLKKSRIKIKPNKI